MEPTDFEDFLKEKIAKEFSLEKMVSETLALY